MFARFLATAALALAIPGCSGTGASVATAPPAPLAQTTIDERGLILAWSSYDAALDAVDILVRRRVIVPGSPRAIALSGALQRAHSALQAASAARRAGQATSYFAAAAEASNAMTAINTALKGL